MVQLERGFRQLGLEWILAGNFIAVDFARDAAPINQALLREGVIVRPVAGYGMPTFLRVSIGTERENARFLDVLAQVLQAVSPAPWKSATPVIDRLVVIGLGLIGGSFAGAA